MNFCYILLGFLILCLEYLRICSRTRLPFFLWFWYLEFTGEHFLFLVSGWFYVRQKLGFWSSCFLCRENFHHSYTMKFICFVMKCSNFCLIYKYKIQRIEEKQREPANNVPRKSSRLLSWNFPLKTNEHLRQRGSRVAGRT